MRNLRVILFSITLFAFVTSCKQHTITKEEQQKRKDSLINVLMDLERTYSASSMKKGFYHARLDYIGDSSIDLMEGQFPVWGKIAEREFADMHTDTTFKLQWVPLRAEIAESGDLGYTFGTWVMDAKTRAGHDTTYYGNYMTVWHKQSDGSWKYEIDGGSDTPKPQE